MATKYETAVVKLIAPASRCGRPHVAEATVGARLTPKQIIIEDQRHPQIIYVNGYTRGPTGIGSQRCWRHNGMRVGGNPGITYWQLADGELERLNNEACEREMKR